jgi:ADP-ribose pyrophosphatase YjhB (NUDIX family)
MRKAVRTIVIHGDRMLVMKRNKFGSEYYTLIGGKIDLGENAEQAIVREVKEETRLDLINPRLVFVEEAGDPFGTQYIYLSDLTNYAEPELDQASTEKSIHSMGQNLYQPMWLPLSDLPKAPFRSETLKEAILSALAYGFPAEAQTITTREDIRYNSGAKKEDND